MEKSTGRHLHIEPAVRGAVRCTIRKVLNLLSKHRATLSIFRECRKKPNISFEVIMDLKSVCVCVCVCSIRAAEYLSLSPLRCPFISPEHHIGGADNWTLALFFYIKFKGFFFLFIFFLRRAESLLRKLTKHDYMHIKVEYSFMVYKSKSAASHPAE